jgi:hypothetical protein
MSIEAITSIQSAPQQDKRISDLQKNSPVTMSVHTRSAVDDQDWNKADLPVCRFSNE